MKGKGRRKSRHKGEERRRWTKEREEKKNVIKGEREAGER